MASITVFLLVSVVGLVAGAQQESNRQARQLIGLPQAQGLRTIQYSTPGSTYSFSTGASDIRSQPSQLISVQQPQRLVLSQPQQIRLSSAQPQQILLSSQPQIRLAAAQPQQILLSQPQQIRLSAPRPQQILLSQPQQISVRQQPILSSSSGRPIAILRQAQDNGLDGSYTFSFESEDGIAVQTSAGPLTLIGPEEGTQTVTGTFSYTAPDGTPITTNWIADENGFRAEGAHLPKEPQAS